MKIGNVETKNNLVLAPMAGITTSAFRTICIENGAGLVYAEMVSDKGITYSNKKTLNMVDVWDNEHPLSMQLFGSDPLSLTNAAKIVDAQNKIDILDINMGCPVKKVVSSGAGSALLKNPDLIYSIVKSLTDNVKVPVTVKIRTGWDHNSINCCEVAKTIEKAGASAIAIHGRTRSDMYLNTANYELIRDVKEAVSIPVIGNGDVVGIESAIKMASTGVDGIMIGRGACGNPWIFKELSTYFEKGEIISRPSKKEIIDMMLLHASRLMMQKGEHIAVVEMRTHAAMYLRQLIGTKNYKVKAVKIETMQDLINVANEVLNDELIYVK